jgi:hypothetical protein
LDYNKNWYSNHDLLFGYRKSNRRDDESAVFQLSSSEVRKVNIADLQDRNGKQPSYRWFNGRRQKAKEVYTITSVGIFLLAMRQRNPREERLESSAYQTINRIVDTVYLEQFSGVNSEATSSNHEPISPKRIRMNPNNKRHLFSLHAQETSK